MTTITYGNEIEKPIGTFDWQSEGVTREEWLNTRFETATVSIKQWEANRRKSGTRLHHHHAVLKIKIWRATWAGDLKAIDQLCDELNNQTIFLNVAASRAKELGLTVVQTKR